jgi:hypothetical protein
MLTQIVTMDWQRKSLGRDLQPRTPRASFDHGYPRHNSHTSSNRFLKASPETVLTRLIQLLLQKHVSMAKERGQVIPLQRHCAPIQNFNKCGKRKCHQAEKQSGPCSTFPLASCIVLDSSFRQVIVRVYLLRASRVHFLSTYSLCR